jgi:hypothetical protein
MSKTKSDAGSEWLGKDKRIWARHAMWAVEDKPARDEAMLQLPDASAKAEPINPHIRQPAVGPRATDASAADGSGDSAGAANPGADPSGVGGAR